MSTLAGAVAKHPQAVAHALAEGIRRKRQSIDRFIAERPPNETEARMLSEHVAELERAADAVDYLVATEREREARALAAAEERREAGELAEAAKDELLYRYMTEPAAVEAAVGARERAFESVEEPGDEEIYGEWSRYFNR